MAGAAARGSISGDAVQQFCSPAAAQMILCDGMGTGRPAAVDGNLAAELTARLLKAGFTAELVFYGQSPQHLSILYHQNFPR